MLSELKYFVIIQKYLGVTSGFGLIYFLNWAGLTEALAIYIALQTINELMAIVDSGNRAKSIEKGQLYIYPLGLPILLATVTLLALSITFYLLNSPSIIWLSCLILMCLTYPLNLASFINLYDQKYLFFSIPIIFTYVFNWIFLFISFYWFDANIFIPLLSFVILPSIAGGFFGFRRIRFRLKFDREDVGFGTAACLLYFCSFLGLSSVFVLYSHSADIVLLGITIKILSVSNLLSQNFNLFASEFRLRSPNFTILIVFKILGQSLVSTLTLYIVVYFGFSNLLSSLNLYYLLFCFLFVFGSVIAAAYGANILAKGQLLSYLVVEGFAAAITMAVRFAFLHDTGFELLISINIFIFTICMLFYIGSKMNGTR